MNYLKNILTFTLLLSYSIAVGQDSYVVKFQNHNLGLYTAISLSEIKDSPYFFIKSELQSGRMEKIDSFKVVVSSTRKGRMDFINKGNLLNKNIIWELNSCANGDTIKIYDFYTSSGKIKKEIYFIRSLPPKVYLYDSIFIRDGLFSSLDYKNLTYELSHFTTEIQLQYIKRELKQFIGKEIVVNRLHTTLLDLSNGCFIEYVIECDNLKKIIKLSI